MLKYSILIPSYNRHFLFQDTIKSLINQTYNNFEVLIIDNGSKPPIKDLALPLMDSRFKLIRYEENTDHFEMVENFVSGMTGDYFLYLGDDDALVPNALEIITAVLRNPGIEMLSIGFAYFNHIAGRGNVAEFKGDIVALDGKDVACHFFDKWGIGPKKIYRGPRMTHPSGSFISKKLIERTRKKQGGLFVRPFGDVGYLGCCINTGKAYYIDLPLAIIGQSAFRETDGMKPGQRAKLAQQIKYLEHSPIKGVSFCNLAVDAHLKIVHRNELNYDSRLRPDFYFRHLKEITLDSPWTRTTIRDIVECIPHYFVSIRNFYNTRDLISEMLKISKGILKLIKTKGLKMVHRREKVEDRNYGNSSIVKFKDVNRFACWVDDNYVKPLSKNLGIKTCLFSPSAFQPIID